jgi:hypothetical protein
MKSFASSMVWLRRRRIAAGLPRLLALLLLSTATACSYLEVDIQSDSQSWARSMQGRGAVVCAQAEPHHEPRCVLIIYGDVAPPNPGARLAEHLTDAAAEHVSFQMIGTEQVGRALIRDERRQPLPESPEQGAALAQKLDCDWFLTGRVELWHTRYVLLQSWSTIKFEVVCMARAGMLPDSEREVWRATVRCRMRGVDDTEVAERAVRALFDRIRGETAE